MEKEFVFINKIKAFCRQKELFSPGDKVVIGLSGGADSVCLFLLLVRLAKELDLITLTHAGFDGAFPSQEIKCTPRRVLNALDKIGGYQKLVLAHLGGNQLYKEVYDTLAGEDVYFDTSYVLKELDRESFLKMLEKHGEDKILFATDCPWQSQREMVSIFNGYGLGKQVDEKILFQNAKKLLNI